MTENNTIKNRQRKENFSAADFGYMPLSAKSFSLIPINMEKIQPIRKKREPPTSLQSAVLEGPVIRVNYLLLTDNLSSV